MGLSRVADGWILESGELRRKLKRLSTVWELVTTEGLELKDIFINERVQKLAVVSMPKVNQPVINLENTDKKIALIEKYAIALPPTSANWLKDFSLEQITLALDYYKATIAKGREIKSATGWLLKCLKEQWYKNFIPEPSPYSPKIFTAADLPQVEKARFPCDFWEKARSHMRGEVSEVLQERLDALGVPY